MKMKISTEVPGVGPGTFVYDRAGGNTGVVIATPTGLGVVWLGVPVNDPSVAGSRTISASPYDPERHPRAYVAEVG
jgi:hypothetical protein